MLLSVLAVATMQRISPVAKPVSIAALDCEEESATKHAVACCTCHAVLVSGPVCLPVIGVSHGTSTACFVAVTGHCNPFNVGEFLQASWTLSTFTKAVVTSHDLPI